MILEKATSEIITDEIEDILDLDEDNGKYLIFHEDFYLPFIINEKIMCKHNERGDALVKLNPSKYEIFDPMNRNKHCEEMIELFLEKVSNLFKSSINVIIQKVGEENVISLKREEEILSCFKDINKRKAMVSLCIASYTLFFKNK